MTTNNEGAIDPAFKRRMKFKIELDRPDEATRARLWRRLLPPALRRPAGHDRAQPMSDTTSGNGKTAGERLHEDIEHEIASVLERTARRVSTGALELSFDVVREACVDELRASGRLVRDPATGSEVHGWGAAHAE